MRERERTRAHAVRALTGVLGLVMMVAGCRQVPATRDLDPAQLVWATYVNEEAGYSLSYPTVLRPEEYGQEEVLFRLRGVPVIIRYGQEEGCASRGLWCGHDPVGSIELAGFAGDQYIYDHSDGPFLARTVSYVITHNGEPLALEFRTPAELDAVQQRMLDSFALR